MIIHLNSLNSKLEGLFDRYNKTALLKSQKAALLVRSYAKDNIYRSLKTKLSSSPLAETITVEGSSFGYVVSTNVPYAKYIEFGTIYQSAKPFMSLAAEQVKSSGGLYG